MIVVCLEEGVAPDDDAGREEGREEGRNKEERRRRSKRSGCGLKLCCVCRLCCAAFGSRERERKGEQGARVDGVANKARRNDDSIDAMRRDAS